MSLLFDEAPLVVNPKLAALIGVNEAIVLQQIHYWLEINRKAQKNFKSNKYWTWNTRDAWLEQFPWLSLSTLKRVLSKLESKGLLQVRRFNAKDWDQTKWYTLDYTAIAKLPETPETTEEQHRFKMSQSDGSEWSDRQDQNEPISTEINSIEFISENSNTDKRISTDPLTARSFKKGNKGIASNGKVKTKASLSNNANTLGKVSEKSKGLNEPPSFLSSLKNIDRVWFDEDGFAAFPRSHKVSAQRAIATRLLQEELACDVIERIDLEEDESGKWVICHINDTEPIDEAFKADGNLNLRSLRNFAMSLEGLPQSTYNEMLEYAWQRACWWVATHPKNAFKLLGEWVEWRECVQEKLDKAA